MDTLMALLGNPVWFTALSTVFGSAITYFATKNNNKKELSINDRMQLSKDQYQLISELRTMMAEQRDEMEGLRDEIKALQAVNITLTIENKELQANMKELNNRLTNMAEGKQGS